MKRFLPSQYNFLAIFVIVLKYILEHPAYRYITYIMCTINYIVISSKIYLEASPIFDFNCNYLYYVAAILPLAIVGTLSLLPHRYSKLLLLCNMNNQKHHILNTILARCELHFIQFNVCYDKKKMNCVWSILDRTQS